MCGFAGFLTPGGFHRDGAERIGMAMRDRLAHRGPDDAGLWMDAPAGIALLHRRLAILDLSPAGHQPMMSASGRFCLAFNGEIYNHLEIRRQLEATRTIAWRSTSDTETLLAALDAWDIDRALNACIGMFAFGVWDRETRTLTLARDRLGEKPLYYGWQGNTFLFGSELKALQAHPSFRSEIDRDVLPLYLRHGYIPAPWSVWRGVRKLPPGCRATISGAMIGTLPRPVAYWSFSEAVQRGKQAPFEGSDEEAIDALETCLSAAVTSQMMADVPLGAFLSGGIDSSCVVALMQARAASPVKTFSIGFREEDYNEAHHAKRVAAHLGTDHSELYVSSADARLVVPSLPRIFDEPFGDSSAIPTYLVSQLARRDVAVALSGDGGDELFAGYDRYFNAKAERMWRGVRALPRGLAGLGRSIVAPLGEGGAPIGRKIQARIQLLADLSACQDHPSFYRRMTSQWPAAPVGFEAEDRSYGFPHDALARVGDPIDQMMATDTVTYLPDDILVKVDRAAMAHSLETRVPLLDHRVVEFAWRLPKRWRVRDGVGKWILRQVAYRHIPRHLLERPKMGFGVPVDEWMRGPLREWADHLLDGRRLREQGMLDPGPIGRRWKEHRSGQANWRDSLWLVLMWEAWLDSQRDLKQPAESLMAA